MIRYSAFWSFHLPLIFAILTACTWVFGQCLRWSMSMVLIIGLPFLHVCSVLAIALETKHNKFSLVRSPCNDNEEEEEPTSASVGPFGCFTIIQHRRQVRRERKEILDEVDAMLRPRSLSIIYIFAPILGLLVLLLHRLILGEFHFAGDAPALNFGPIGGGIGTNTNIVSSRNNSNNSDMSIPWEDAITFDSGLYSVINYLLGLCATLFAYPVVLTGPCFGCCRTSFWYLLQAISSFSTMYPVFTCVLHYLRSAGYFATSYYTKDVMEWVSGAVTGMVLGLCMTAAVKGRMLELEKKKREENIDNNSSNSNGENSNEEGGDDHTDSDSTSKWSHPEEDDLFNLLQCGMGCLFMMSVVASSFQIAFTWNHCPNGNNTCVNYSEKGIPKVMTTISVAISIYIFVIILTKERVREYEEHQSRRRTR